MKNDQAVRSVLALCLLAGLACGLFTPAMPPAYLGQFDCYGTEGGLGAYSGRITVKPGGAVTFKDYDGQVQTGAWTYNAPSHAFNFTGRLSLASAVYTPASDSLAVVVAAGAQVVHAEGGSMQCQRARPGITGPP